MRNLRTRLSTFLGFAIILVLSCVAGFASALKTIHIGGLFPLSPVRGREAFASGELMRKAASMAVDDINNKREILPGYQLKLHANDTQCLPSLASRVLFDLIHEGPTKLVLLGAGCSGVSRRIAEAAKTWNLNMVSYGSTSPALSDNSKYPMFMRVIPSDSACNMAVIALLKRFDWKKVALIKKNDVEYSAIMDDLQDTLYKFGMNVITSESFSGDPSAALKQVKAKDARIIVGYFDEASARQVLCQAYREDLYGGRYVWFLPGWFEKDWWRVRLPEEHINCTRDQMKTAVQGYFGTVNAKIGPNLTSTYSGMSPQRFLERLQSAGYPTANNTDAGFAYDAVWSIALALNKSGQQLHSRTGLENFTYTDHHMAISFRNGLLATRFTGITGEVSFTPEGGRNGFIQVTQMQDGVIRRVVLYSSYKNGSLLDQEGAAIVWPGGQPPLDSSVLVIKLQTISPTLYALICVITVLCILLAFSFLAFNIMYRNYRYIKMSSPRLNNAIIAGCILVYLSVFLFGMDNNTVSPSDFTVVCQVRMWLGSLGFTLSYGAMFAKTWRVYVIFTNAKLRKRVIHDGKLFLLVAVLLVVDVIILSLWSGIDHMERRLSNETIVRGENTDTLPQLEYCHCEYKSVWLGLLYAYKGLLLLFGVFLAWETRHVNIPALNDAHYIGMSVYNVFIIGVIGVPIAMVIEHAQDAAFALSAAFLIFCTTVTLCLVFIPKIVQFKFNPSGFNAAASVSGTSSNQSSHGDSKLSSDKELKGSKAIALAAENSNIKKLIVEKETEISQLQRKLRAGSFTPEQLKRITQLFSKTSLTESLNLAVPVTAPHRVSEGSIHVEISSELTSDSADHEDKLYTTKHTRTRSCGGGGHNHLGAVQDRENALARKQYSSVIGSSTQQSNCREQDSGLSTDKESLSCYQNPVAIESDDVKGACSKRTPIEAVPGSYLLPDLRRGETAGSKETNARKQRQRQFESGGTQHQDINANKASEVALSFPSGENDRKSSVVLMSRAETGEPCFQVQTPANQYGSSKPASRRVSRKKHEDGEMHV